MERVNLKLEEVLKVHGYSITKPRVAVFDYLLGKEPVAVNKICNSLSAIDRASIYRTLNLFQQLGITHRHTTGWKYKVELSDMFMPHHHHLSCKQCGKVIPINEGSLEQLIKDLAAVQEFTVTQHVVELQGLCSGCV